MAIIEYARGSNEKLTKNFLKKEFDCTCGGKYCKTTKHDTELSTKLQIMRDFFGKPIIPTSPYRCPTRNKEVGGGSLSYHTKGMACDFYIPDLNVSEICKVAQAIGFNGIGIYPDDGFVHCDVRPASEKFFWKGHEETPVSSFGGENLNIYVDSAPEVKPNAAVMAEEIKNVLKKYGFL